VSGKTQESERLGLGTIRYLVVSNAKGITVNLVVAPSLIQNTQIYLISPGFK